ncbi:B-cell linker protein isoform X2 [Sphaerodactylus townsendi]|uniref:B-cell linker protein isoform X2 n=1 Tax=Sphaerodactylus townsendi TaxID=933632 RepID=UPI0020268531|nr:B-cell linker protein isoform X2 [Sphaerodactylus townsendi]
MATKLPIREECDNWTPFQVADLLRQCGMYDCARIVEKFNIDGAQFLSLSDYEMNRFSIMDQPQLQKIMHDIKKNDSGIMSKFKKLTSKPPPSVPPVDYVPEPDDDQWSDDFENSDYENPDDPDSDTYVVPNGDNGDDSYEPPPSEKENKKIPAAFSISRGEYADNRSSQQPPQPIAKLLPTLPGQPSSKPKILASLPPPSLPLKPKIPLKQQECTDNEADYVVPVDDEDEDDNYIEPTEESPPQPIKPPAVNRAVKPTAKLDPSSSSVLPPAPESPSMLDVYEIPEEEEKSSPPLTRISKPLPPKPVQRAGGHSHVHNTAKELLKPDMSRNFLPPPRNRHQLKFDPDDFEVQSDESHNSNGTQESKFPSGAVPSPLPRVMKKTPNPAIPSKPSLPGRDHPTMNEDRPIPAERRQGSNHDLPLPPIPSNIHKPLLQKPPFSLRSPDPLNRSLATPRSRISSTTEQDPSIHGKAWFTASSDRKIAEDALYRSNKDGSFLVRKSSGQDSKQPYTLVVFYNKRVYNIPIRFIESTRQYALGREKSGEERFDSVTEIIENHQRNSLVLIDSQNNTKDSTKLKFITRV